jgi:hypothetical protein
MAASLVQTIDVFPSLANVAMRDPRRASRMQDRFRSGASAEIDDADVTEGENLGRVDARLAESGHRGGDPRADIRLLSSELSRDELPFGPQVKPPKSGPGMMMTLPTSSPQGAAADGVSGPALKDEGLNTGTSPAPVGVTPEPSAS